ncbi:hypothetical protein BaRGS_00021787, partial [Batillaria attramentaria]
HPMLFYRTQQTNHLSILVAVSGEDRETRGPGWRRRRGEKSRVKEMAAMLTRHFRFVLVHTRHVINGRSSGVGTLLIKPFICFSFLFLPFTLPPPAAPHWPQSRFQLSLP